LGQHLRQLLRLGAVLARGGVNRIHALLGLAQALGIEIEFLLVVTQAVNGFLQLHLRRFQHVEHLFEFGIVIEQVFHSRYHAIDLRQTRTLAFG
jgi:hypothetical protein